LFVRRRRRACGSRSPALDGQVYVDGDVAIDTLCHRVQSALDNSRVIGTDLNVRGPRQIGVIVGIDVVVAPDASENDVLRRVSAAVTAALDAEHLTLGSTVYASWFVAAAMRTSGVAEADLTAFRRFGGPDRRAEGLIRFDSTEKAAIVDASGIATGGRPTLAVRR